MVPYYVQFVQAPKHLIIPHEYCTSRGRSRSTARRIRPIRIRSGGALGRPLEGDTLVVDSVGFKESEISGYKTTEDLHVVERFRPNLGTLEYEAVIEDQNVFAGPWLITRTFPLLPEFNRVDEFFCENNGTTSRCLEIVGVS